MKQRGKTTIKCEGNNKLTQIKTKTSMTNRIQESDTIFISSRNT